MGYSNIRLEITHRQHLSPQLQQSLRVLGMSSWELREYMMELQTGNVMLAFDGDGVDFQPEDSRPTWDRRRLTDAFETDAASWEIPVKETLYDFLTSQLDIVRMSHAEIAAAKRIIQSLDDDGYLRTSLSSLFKGSGLPDTVIRSAFRQVRSLDPAGVGAVSLGDCLRLQLDRSGNNDPVLRTIVAHHLKDLASARYKTIAKSVGLSLQSTIAQCEIIRGLSPKPLSFCQEIPATVPDVIVELEAGGLHLHVNDSFLPKLHIDPYYASVASTDETAKQFLHDQLTKAKSALNAISLRQSTLSLLAQRIVAAQLPFFMGEEALNPLSRSALAGELNLHESTVCRAVQGKYLRCNWGLYPLSHFFSTELTGNVSADAAKQLIRTLIDEQPGISDEALSAALQTRGVPVARRTVAKYRETMGIPSCHQRIRFQCAKANCQ